MMNKKRALDLLLELIREELWQQPVCHKTDATTTFTGMMQIAEEQCVQGLVINSLFRRNENIGKSNVLKCLSYKQQIEKNNKKLDDALVKLAAVLNAHNIGYVVFKGQTAAAYYPNPALRMAGDIDFYCADADYRRAQGIITKELGVNFEPTDIVDRHDSFTMDGVSFEMHYKMEILGSARHQNLYDSIMDRAVAEPLYIDFGGTPVATLAPTYNVLHIFKHLFNHLLVEGVGIRQFCDLAIILERNAGLIDADLLERSLRGIGYWKAFLATGAFLVKHLGLSAVKFPYHLSDKDYAWGDKILNAVMAHGNFGRFNRRKTSSRVARSLETARIAFGHCLTFFPLAPTDIIHLIPRRIGITLKKY